MVQVAVTSGQKAIFTFVPQGFNIAVTIREIESGMPLLFGVEVRAVQNDRAVIWVKINEEKWVFDFHCLRPFALDKKLPGGCTAITARVSIVWREGEWRAELLGERVFRGDEPVLLGRPVLLGDVIGQAC